MTVARRRARCHTELRKQLLAKQGRAGYFQCCYCEHVLAGDLATLEHIIPLQFGGTYEPANLALACEDCNQQRNIFVTKVLAGRNPRELMRHIPPHVLRGIVMRGDQCFFVNHLAEAA